MRRPIPFLFLFFFTFAALYSFHPFPVEEPYISADAVFDAQIARNILLDGELGWPATLQPPLQAILATLIYPFKKNILISGIIISKFMFLLLPLAVYLLAKELFSKKIAFFSMALSFFHPHFFYASQTMEPTVTYTTLLTFALFFSWRAYSRSNILSAIPAGIFFSLAWLSRSEGFLILLFIILSFSFLLFRKRALLEKSIKIKKVFLLITLLLSFFILSSPYLVFLKNTYGKLVFSPKASYVQIWMKWRIYRDNNYGEIGNEELWGLNEQGKLKWQEPKGIGDLLSYLASHPKKSVKVYLTNLSSEIPGRIGGASGQENYPQVYPFYFFIPALIWILYVIRKKKEGEKLLFILSPFLLLLILPVYTHGWWKYLAPYSPLIIVMAVAGLSNIFEDLKINYALPLYTALIILFAISVTRALPSAERKSDYAQSKASFAEAAKSAGKYAQKQFKGSPNYMVQWLKLTYYLDGRWTAMPVTSFSRMIEYARNKNVDYLVFEGPSDKWERELIQVMKFRRLEPAGIYRSDKIDYRVLFFKLNK
ncbi:MAG: glycosyltransferase family 39 protein [Deltaproteobacteria bacterium]|nr:glycosyltransferase family 39 protein [Deltaproteobacteria bacterium]